MHDESQSGPADLVVTGARVWTQDPQHPWAGALGVRGGRIIAVGAAGELTRLIGPQTLWGSEIRF